MQTRIRRFLAPALFLGGLVAGAAITVPVMAGQPHMNAALSSLQKAQTQLQSAEADKAGHRDKAIGLVQQAIEQVNLGIAAGASKM
jgi:hypothetical protein